MKKIMNILNDLNIIFGNVGENFWRKKITNLLEILKEEKTSKLNIEEEISSWYGGMGSFNDLYICKENGYEITEDEEKNINSKIVKLQEDLWLCVESLDKRK